MQVLPFQNSLKDLDPSYKTDLDLWDCFERKKICLISKEIWYKLQPAFSLVLQEVLNVSLFSSTVRKYFSHSDVGMGSSMGTGVSITLENFTLMFLCYGQGTLRQAILYGDRSCFLHSFLILCATHAFQYINICKNTVSKTQI